MTLFDLIAGLVLVASALMGFLRGATREVTTAVAFVLAAIIAVVGLRFTGPIARHAIATPWMANVATLLILFIAAYIILRLIGGALTRGVQRTGLSGLDRTLGLALGLARGLVVIGGLVLLIDAATPATRVPEWITKAKLYPLADASGALLRVFAPQGWKLAGQVAPPIANAVLDTTPNGDDRSTGDSEATSPSKRDSGYSTAQRKALDVLVEKSR